MSNEQMTDIEYRQFLWDLLHAAKEMDGKRQSVKNLEERKKEIYSKITAFLKDAIDAEKMGYDHSDPAGRKYKYSINFRISVGPLHKYSKMGFFFHANHGWSNFRVKDYDNTYRGIDTGPSNIFLVMDYAEDIIDKCRTRMKLSKYNSKYDLGPLIDVLHTFSVLRGNKYMAREGRPPLKYRADRPVDPITGKEIKVIGSAKKFMVPFKIKSVTISSEE